MPHKHTRRDKDESTYDLPPTQIARPLPVVTPKQNRQTSGKGKRKDSRNGSALDHNPQGIKRKRRGADQDDAPRAFKRLMALAEGKKPRSGLDDGRRENDKKNNKKRKTATTDGANAADDNKATEAVKKEIPTIRPGERMSEFAARVDAALPVMGLVGKATKGKDPLGLKAYRTRKEKKMHKLYDEWRREEAAIQDKRREEREEAEEREMEENDGLGVKWRIDMEGGAAGGRKKKGKKGKKAKSVWEVDEEDDGDPWAELKKKRGEAKIGLHDVAKAPPVLKSVPKQLFKVGGAAVDVGSVPKSAGSLKRREELQGVRDEVVAQYRRIMEGKRARLEAQAEAEAS